MRTVKKKRNCLLAIILTLALCFSLLPTASLAQSPAPADEPTLTELLTDEQAPADVPPPAGSPAEVPAASIQIGVYTTTDMHGKVYDQNPVGGSIANSYLKVAAAMEQERATVDGTILIDNGDSIQGTAITSYNVNVQSGENNPVALCLRYCGYDMFVPGNHEFNYTLEVQNNFYDMLAAPADGSGQPDALPGTPVAAVCANLLDTGTGEVAAPYVPYIIKEFTVGDKTFKIGVLGFENMNVPNWDVASHYEGMQFWSDDNAERSYAWEWENKWQAELKEAGCDIVIVAAHSGEGSASSFNVESQVAHFVANTTGIDMVVAGHNHSSGTRTLTNGAGKSVPCVNGGTSQLTKTVITLNSDGTYEFGESSLIALSSKDLSNDAGLKALIQPVYDLSVAFVQSPIGTLSGEWDSISSYHTKQADTYDLVHKAQIWAAKEGLARSDEAGKYADTRFVSITTPVANRGFTLSSLFADGADTADISLKDCYSFYKYDNNLLYAIEMTGQQLKNWLEHCTKTYSIKDGSVSGGGFGTDIAYGINYDVYLGEAEGNRVRNMTWPDGSEVKPTDTFVVALSSYRLAANAEADEYGWFAATGIDMSQAIWDGTVDAEFGAVGGSVTLIIGEYIKATCAGGSALTPGAETHWTVNAGKDAAGWDCIPVFETTDVHGYLMDTSSGNPDTFQHRLAYISNIVTQAREDSSNEGVLLLDGGDIYQGTPVSNMTYGNAIRAAYDKMNYDAVCLGNHEFDWGVTIYAAESDGTMPSYSLSVGESDPSPITGNSSIPVLASNLYYAENSTEGTPGERVSFTKDYVVVEKGDYTIAIVGYIPDYSSDIMTARIAPYEIKDDIDALKTLCSKVKADEKADVVIVLAHASPSSIANSMDPEVVNLVCGGHSHTGTAGTSKTTGIPYIQGNCQGQGYATAEIHINRSTREIRVESPAYIKMTDSSNLYNTEANTDKLNQEIVAIGSKSWDSVGDVMGEVLGQVDTDITRTVIPNSKLSSVAGNWMAGLMNRATGSVIACTNGGGIRCDLKRPVGSDTRNITVGDIYTISPFGNKVMAYDLNGQEIADLMNYALTGKLSLRFFGCDVEYYTTGSGRDAVYHTTKITLSDGTQVYPVTAGSEAKTYLVSTNEYVATSEGTPFVGKMNVNAGTEPIDNESAIEALRAEGLKNDGKLAVDTTGHFKQVSAPVQATEIMVMSTTDMHGKVWNTDVLTDAEVKNSFLKVAAAVKGIRETYGENTILVDNGDLFQGTTISTYNILSSGGRDNPMVLALRSIGYDAFVLGNHEFNYPWETTQAMYAQLSAADDGNGSSVPVLAANLYWRDGDNQDKNAFTPYTTKTFEVNGQAFKVGIIGFENTDCDQFDVPANFGVNSDGTGGVTLTPPGNPTRDMAVEAQKYVTQLRKPAADGGEGCDFVIVSYHSGMGGNNITGDLTIGTNTENQVARMVAGNTGIDLVIAGHDHQSYRSRTAKDANGRDIPVINGGGSSLARALLSVTYDAESGFSVTVADQGNLSLNSLENDAGLTALIKPAADAAVAYVNAKYGTAIGQWDGSTQYKMGHNDTIDLINRAQIWTAGENGVKMDAAATTSIVSGNYVVSTGDISLKDIYRMYRYDNYLYAVEMTGAQLKDWLEGVAAFYSAQVDGDDVTYKVQNNFVTALFYGLDFQYDLAKPEGERVVNLKRSSSGEAITADSTLVVGVNNYVIGQDPFVKAMGKDASSTEEKAEIIAGALWSSQDALGDEQGLVTQMVANFVKSETEGTAHGIAPAPSGWSLGYDVAVTDPDDVYVPSTSGKPSKNTSKISVGGDKVSVTLNAGLSGAQQAQLIRENASKPIVISGKELTVTIPAGTLSSGADINAMIVNPTDKGDVIQVTLEDGSSVILPFSVIDGTAVSYIAQVTGSYKIVDNGKHFEDVSSGYWAADAITFVTSREFFNGTGAGSFSPDALMTRSMLVTVLHRIAGGDAATVSSFTDVARDTWYTDAVDWAAEAGVVTGTGGGFYPDGAITREQLCTILIRYMEYAGIALDEVSGTDGLTDLGTVSSWAGDSMELCVKYGLISGKPGGLSDPQGIATRAEIATILTRFVQSVVK